MIKVIWPEYISLKEWADRLVGDYDTEFLPILQHEEEWEEWGAIVAGTGIFVTANIPAPFVVAQGARQSRFQDWQAWAKVVYNNMANADSNFGHIPLRTLVGI